MKTKKDEKTNFQIDLNAWTGSTTNQPEQECAQEIKDAKETVIDVGSIPTICERDAKSHKRKTTDDIMQLGHCPNVQQGFTKPVILPFAAVTPLLKRDARGNGLAMVKYKVKENKLPIVFTNDRRIYYNFNKYAASIFAGALCEMCQQSPYIEGFINECKKVAEQNREIAKLNTPLIAQNTEISKHNEEIQQQNELKRVAYDAQGTPENERVWLQYKNQIPLTPAISMPTTVQSGFTIFGQDKTQMTDEELQWLDEQDIKKDEPIALIDVPRFIEKYLGVKVGKHQYMTFRDLIADVGKSDYAMEFSDGWVLSQLFVTTTKYFKYNRRFYSIIKMPPVVFREFGTNYMKVPENFCKTTKQLGVKPLEIRLFVFFINELKVHTAYRKAKREIKKTYNVHELIERVASETDVDLRNTHKSWATLEKRFYSALEILKNEGVILHYSAHEMNNDGNIEVIINPSPYNRQHID